MTSEQKDARLEYYRDQASMEMWYARGCVTR